MTSYCKGIESCVKKACLYFRKVEIPSTPILNSSFRLTALLPGRVQTDQWLYNHTGFF